MPEIAEVARVVNHLRRSLVGKTLKTVATQDDTNVYGKAGCSAAEFSKALTGKKVLEANRQGKYFWLVMDSPPHPLMHLGMTGWVHIHGDKSMVRKSKPKDEDAEWPPKYWKFVMETDEDSKMEVAFKDARRFARIRLLDCAAADIRNTTPLKENGPDPVIDTDVFTEEWFMQKMISKHVPVKALLLNQANISGIGNWVGDEIMYHAKLHPEQYSNTFGATELKQLYNSIRYVCQTAVDLLGDSSQFPDEWLFNYRWGKGKKNAATKLPNGAAITFLTVGGRTSCVVPSVQKKIGPVTADVKGGEAVTISGGSEAEPISKPVKRKKHIAKASNCSSFEEESDEDVKEKDPPAKRARARKPPAKIPPKK
ncbi:Formamidopyrimidine-DNA glycosylase N-terminal domain-containing protein [Calycina marina]|uniref:Formamidopyrimidine-DNA glycosylase N-terminal domain-containing protein n=1 Tax=Calycina marina TaxID=1763456 RepID=A0A9P7Z7D1_9HELO|nr:Formamidopyrimidine-DNA glycosylase N-terminal domain-containing protein [Calycina marina]